MAEIRNFGFQIFSWQKNSYNIYSVALVIICIFWRLFILSCSMSSPGHCCFQSLSHIWLFVTPWTAARQAFLSFTISKSLLKFMSVESVMPSNHLILCFSILLLPSIFKASGSFPMSWLFTSGGQSIGTSASASVLPMNILGWFPFGLTGLISLQSRDSQESSPVPHFEPQVQNALLSTLFFLIILASN